MIYNNNINDFVVVDVGTSSIWQGCWFFKARGRFWPLRGTLLMFFGKIAVFEVLFLIKFFIFLFFFDGKIL